MTPQSEGFYDAPVSKVTLGALQDLGYTVNYFKADNFEPLKFNVNYGGDTNTPLCIDFYNMTGNAGCVLGYVPTYNLQLGKVIYLKRGLNYTFFLNSIGTNIKICNNSDGTGALTSSEGVINNDTNIGSIQYDVPTSLASGTIKWLFADNPHAKAQINII